MSYSFISMSQVYDLALSGSGGSGSGGGGGYVTSSFTNQSTWSFAHNLGSQYVSFEVYDSNNNVIIPQKITATNENNVAIYFPVTKSGTVAAGFAGSVTTGTIVSASYAITASHAENTVSSSYSLFAQTASYAESPKIMMFAISDEITEFIASTGVFQFRMPFDMTVDYVRATVNIGGNSDTSSFDINKNGASILSTIITIEPNESSSFTAPNQPVISTPSLADDDLISIDIDIAATGSISGKIIMKGY